MGHVICSIANKSSNQPDSPSQFQFSELGPAQPQLVVVVYPISHCVLQVHTLGDSCVLDLDVLLPCSLDLVIDKDDESLEVGLEEEEDSRTHALLSLNLMM